MERGLSLSVSFLPSLLLKVAAGYSEVDTRRTRTMRQNFSQKLTWENSYETLGTDHEESLLVASILD